ncbi:MAG: aldo/keto reductase [Micromonosporaceae bacterium]
MVSGTSQPRLLGENLNANVAIIDRVMSLAEQKNVTPAQLALAWVHHQGDDILPIPGTKRRRYLEENIAAADIELTPGDLEALAEVGEAQGDRYTDMSRING